MSREQPLKGRGNQLHAQGFLDDSFLDVFGTTDGSAIDLECGPLRVSRGALDVYRAPTLRYHVQVKSGDSYWHKGFRVRQSTFDRWLQLFETEPVILLYVQRCPGRAAAQEYWFLALHDWLLSHVDNESVVAGSTGPRFNIKADFTRSDPDGQILHQAMRREADRATQAADSLFATLRDYRLLPLSLRDFLRHVEIASRTPPPARLLTTLAADAVAQIPHFVSRLLRGEGSGDPAITQWWQEIQSVAPPRLASSFERRQLLEFFGAMATYEQGVTLPPFRIGEVNCWRAFSAMFPHSLKMFDHVIRHSQHENDLIFAASVLPVLASSTEPAVSTGAMQALRRFMARGSDFGSYGFQRELRRAPAEAGEGAELKKAISLITDPRTVDLEFSFLESYGWARECLEANISRKLGSPAVRDVPLTPFYEAMGDHLLPRIRSGVAQ